MRRKESRTNEVSDVLLELSPEVLVLVCTNERGYRCDSQQNIISLVSDRKEVEREDEQLIALNTPKSFSNHRHFSSEPAIAMTLHPKRTL